MKKLSLSILLMIMFIPHMVNAKSITAVEFIKQIAKNNNANINSVDEIGNSGLAYDGTSDNNLRYVGKNPNNYVIFNNEKPHTIKKWVSVSIDYNAIDSFFENENECTQYINNNHLNNYYTCEEREFYAGGWRIIGVMNNIDNGSGKKETRIKIVRDIPLGEYSYDTSDNSINNGLGYNDWEQSKLKDELNGDYLNNNLITNTFWYNSYNNVREEVYDYTSGLKQSSQNLIEDAIWYLGKVSYNEAYDDGQGTASKFYNYERRDSTWTGKVSLIYPSDYGFAVSRNNQKNCLSTNLYDYCDTECYMDDWLVPTTGVYERVLTGYSDLTYQTFTLDNTGYMYDTRSYAPQSIYPTVYLKNNIVFTKGTGSIDDPYELGLLENEFVKIQLSSKKSIKDIFKEIDTSNVGWRVEDESVARLEDGIIIPLKEGKTEIIGEQEGIQYRIEVEITSDMLNIKNILENPNTRTGVYIVISIIILILSLSLYLIIKKNKKCIIKQSED